VATKILVVDDDKDIQRLLAFRLGREGYETAFASDGVSAIGAARKESPDLILLDLGLPAGDGFTVLERLHAMPQLSTIPVIVLSARDPAQMSDRALAAGADRFIGKPFEIEQLLEAIKSSLRF
jgi:two-component system KDP operon response regulator KdpE